ncbi:ABC transporter ATP-binding protein [Kyrpidia spormannii]|uniref:ABC transporter ATP-binding protein n=1 Tax=Kyrpidia spormannii TaxID=2055160 RepID=UPI00147611E1|nr:ABC transporter ATP-binding protein [Kyrpidia spormannii]
MTLIRTEGLRKKLWVDRNRPSTQTGQSGDERGNPGADQTLGSGRVYARGDAVPRSCTRQNSLDAKEGAELALELREVSLTYPGSREPAVNEVSLCVRPGEFVVILGPSGCGKSTLLRLIAGFEVPDRGEVVIAGRRVSRAGEGSLPPEKRRIGMVFQSYALWPHKTVRKNLSFPLEQRPMAKNERERRVDEAVERFQLHGLGHRFPAQLSGGQAQRVALARALIAEPPLVLMDEPLSNLDAVLRRTVLEELEAMKASWAPAVVYVTHNREEAIRLGNRILVFQRGQLLQDGSPGDIYHSPQTTFVADFVGESNYIEGRVESEAAPGLFLVRTVDGALLPARGARGVVTNRAVPLLVRPEWASLVAASSDSRPGDTGDLNPEAFPAEESPAVVTSIRYLGQTSTYTIARQNRTFTITDLGEPRFHPGQAVSLRIHDAWIMPDAADPDPAPVGWPRT